MAVLFSSDDPDCDEVVGIGGFCGGITGEQTVPRAEAAGLSAGGRCCYQHSAPLGVLVDNKGAICQSYWPRKRAEAFKAGDIWGEFHEFQATWSGSLAAREVKGHSKEADFESGVVGVADAIANEAADVYADCAASKLEVRGEYE